MEVRLVTKEENRHLYDDLLQYVGDVENRMK